MPKLVHTFPTGFALWLVMHQVLGYTVQASSLGNYLHCELFPFLDSVYRMAFYVAYCTTHKSLAAETQV